MKRAALYLRVSTVDQHPETQVYDLRQLAQQRGYDIVQEFTDRITGAKARRPGLDAMMADARRGRFDVVLVWASDRIARSVKHFLDVLDEFNRLNVEFVSFREQIDTGGPLGRAIVVIVGAIAELERNLIIERVRAGMRRAKLEGRHIGRTALVLDRAAILRDRHNGQSLAQLARIHHASRTTNRRLHAGDSWECTGDGRLDSHRAAVDQREASGGVRGVQNRRVEASTKQLESGCRRDDDIHNNGADHGLREEESGLGSR